MVRESFNLFLITLLVFSSFEASAEWDSNCWFSKLGAWGPLRARIENVGVSSEMVAPLLSGVNRSGSRLSADSKGFLLQWIQDHSNLSELSPIELEDVGESIGIAFSLKRPLSRQSATRLINHGLKEGTLGTLNHVLRNARDGSLESKYLGETNFVELSLHSPGSQVSELDWRWLLKNIPEFSNESLTSYLFPNQIYRGGESLLDERVARVADESGKFDFLEYHDSVETLMDAWFFALRWKRDQKDLTSFKLMRQAIQQSAQKLQGIRTQAHSQVNHPSQSRYQYRLRESDSLLRRLLAITESPDSV